MDKDTPQPNGLYPTQFCTCPANTSPVKTAVFSSIVSCASYGNISLPQRESVATGSSGERFQQLPLAESFVVARTGSGRREAAEESGQSFSPQRVNAPAMRSW